MEEKLLSGHIFHCPVFAHTNVIMVGGKGAENLVLKFYRILYCWPLLFSIAEAASFLIQRCRVFFLLSDRATCLLVVEVY